MIIIHNPTNQNIPGFNFEGEKYADEENPKILLRPNGLLQFPDNVGHFMLETWGFLNEVEPSQVEELLKTPKEVFKCQHCDKEVSTKLALSGHMRSHKAEIEAAGQPQVDPGIVPVVGGVKVARPVSGQEDIREDSQIPKGSGVDGDGVAWYGAGYTEQHADFQPVRAEGQGHFKGGIDE